MLTAGPAAADSPHFLFANNSINTSTGALNTAFKEVGLGTGTTSVGITLTADATATYQCYNKAGNKPQGVPKTFGPSGGVRLGQLPGAQRPDHRHRGGRPAQPGDLPAAHPGSSCSWMR